MFLINPYIYATGAWENLKSISFDGVDEYLTGSTITELSNVSAFSFSLWFRNPEQLSKVGLGQRVDANNLIQINWRYTSGVHSLDVLLSNGGAAINRTGTGLWTNADGWHHLAVVFDGSLSGDTNRLKIYIDGTNSTNSIIAGIPATSPTFTTEAFEVGGLDVASSYLNVSLDELRVYDYALTSGNVTSIYNSGCPIEDDLSTLAVHNWRMGDDDTYPTISDVGTGTATDLTMTNQESNDIVTNTPCGFNNYSLVFDGVDEYLTGSTITELSNTQNFSVSLWAKRLSTGNEALVITRHASLLKLFQINLSTTDLVYAYVGDGGATGNKTAIGSFPLNVWKHIVVVYDGTQGTDLAKLKIYLNGVDSTVANTAGIPSTTPTFTTEPFQVGGSSALSSYANIIVDELRVYDYSLTSGNVTSIYNSGVPIEDDLSTLAVHDWRMGDNDTYPTISDVGTGTATDLTMTNMESGDINKDVP